MTTYIVGGGEALINSDQIVSLNIWGGAGLRENAHPRKDFDSEYSYLIAEMSNGSLHELGLWGDPENARRARRDLIAEILKGDTKIIAVPNEIKSLPRRRWLCSSSGKAQIENDVRAIREIVEDRLPETEETKA
jgi:hypothetical protein